MSYSYRGGSTVTTHPKVSLHAERNGRCPVCARKVRRNVTFENTVNPWNRDPATDRPRTVQQIRAHLAERAKAWEPDFTHERCRTIEAD